ncbi:MAG TPA: hypothetical protein VJ673_01100 [Aromatoleum sp.]|uniref:hypothetical protein n=1 Tax=Aromatoleum sp. TaxID=2307007 RepID=UPI002B460EEE|nr:hypothetical protein [Aromatoleum sp.]HJV24243.1 hypothetical protein [Aromatoleum sp.]
MTVQHSIDLARRYFVDDLPGAAIPASRLRNILDSLQKGRALTPLALGYLAQQGLIALHRFAKGDTTYDEFCAAAGPEQERRQQAAEIERQAQHATVLVRAAEQKAREAEWFARQEAARHARESDPKYLAKLKNQALRESYGIDQYIEKDCFPRLMDILCRIDEGNRLSDDDVLWLTTDGKDYYSDRLQTAFHEREADFYAGEYKRTHDPWNAVNASGHYRKCAQAQRAHDLLISIPAERQKLPKLKSAISTTHGGVMRDLKRWEEALRLGDHAHSLTPNDFRPCTLLGAVNFELGNYDLGRNWYAKAIERGASARSIDYDLRGILLRADQGRREEIKAFLLREDLIRYQWVKRLGDRRPDSQGR